MKTHLTIVLRRLLSKDRYSLINLLALAFSFSVSAILYFFISDQLSYDRFHKNGDRVYRIDLEQGNATNILNSAKVPAMVAFELEKNFPEIESSVRILDYGSYLVTSADQQEAIEETAILWTDNSFFNIFSLDFINGNPNTALEQPYSIVISESSAKKYFPNENAVGQSLVLENRFNAVVTAVYKDLSENSHIQADMLISLNGDWPAARSAKSTIFSQNEFNTYLLLRKGVKPKSIQDKFPEFFKSYIESTSEEDRIKFSLRPLYEIHLKSNLDGELQPNGSITEVYLFGVSAILLIIIGSINFINLTLVQAVNRAKEIGIKKVMGSNRMQMAAEFLLEYSLTVTLAATLGLGLTIILIPYANIILNTELQFPLTDVGFYVIAICAVLIISVLAGGYPAFILSSFKPSSVLKGKVIPLRGSLLRKHSFIFFQLIVALCLITISLAVRQQLAFLQTKNLAFDKDHILIVKNIYSVRPHIQTFKNLADAIPGVKSSTVTGFIPFEGGSEFPRRSRMFWNLGKVPTSDNILSIQEWSVDSDYLETYKMELTKGRNFSKGLNLDVDAVILNECAVKHFQLGENPIGKKIVTYQGDEGVDSTKTSEFTVIGIVRDFHFSSLHKEISPLGLFIGRSDGFLSLSVAGNPQPIIEQLQIQWKKYASTQPFDFLFLDKELSKLYEHEKRTDDMFKYFALIAILIALIGLVSLTAYTIKLKTKEIGIRKIFGASSFKILIYILQPIIKILFLSWLISIPLSYYTINQWLNNFSYKTILEVDIYIWGILSLGIISYLTISIQSLRAAHANPIDSIKS